MFPLHFAVGAPGQGQVMVALSQVRVSVPTAVRARAWMGVRRVVRSMLRPLAVSLPSPENPGPATATGERRLGDRSGSFPPPRLHASKPAQSG